MTIHQYSQLNESRQLNAIAQKGVLIGQREGSFNHLDLYQLEGFYVELCYHTHFNTLITINAFSNTDCLDPYLQQLDIEALMDA